MSLTRRIHLKVNIKRDINHQKIQILTVKKTLNLTAIQVTRTRLRIIIKERIHRIQTVKIQVIAVHRKGVRRHLKKRKAATLMIHQTVRNPMEIHQKRQRKIKKRQPIQRTRHQMIQKPKETGRMNQRLIR